MKTKLGIVGPGDSVDRISNIAEEFYDNIITLPFTYTEAKETKDIIRNAESDVDVWIFSGQAPYSIAKDAGLKQESFFPALNGSSLIKTLLDISYKDKQILDYISLDTIPTEEVHETFSELELPIANLQLMPYSGYRSTDDLTSFHYELFKENKIKIAITCVFSTYKKLKALGVPVYRVTPTKMVLRQTINMAYQQNETMYFKQSQIAVIIIQTHDMDKLMDERKLLTHNHRLNLKLQELIIDFSEDIFGSYIWLGNGKFIIFSTRGALDKYQKSSITSLLEKITLLTNFTSNLGIGYGKTSLEAEQNAYSALNHAKNQGTNCGFLTEVNGSIEGPLKETDSITYNYRTDDKDLEELLSKAGVSISTFNKLIYVQNNFCNYSVSSADIAEWLNMTQRNARRILNDLEKQGLAVLSGQEVSPLGGRPRKIYQVAFKKEEVKS